jgi:hypothetical protein
MPNALTFGNVNPVKPQAFFVCLMKVPTVFVGTVGLLEDHERSMRQRDYHRAC